MPLSTSDFIEIEQLVHRLCQALDFSHPADFASVFVPEGIYEAVSSDLTGNVVRFAHEGSAALLAFAADAVEKRKGLGRHWTGNIVIDEDSDGAKAVSYVLFIQIDPQTGERKITISGVHRDAFVRTAAGWKFTRRRVVADL